MKPSLCAICGDRLRSKKVTIDRMVEGRLYLFENTPVQVCDRCGETWIPGRANEKMDKAIKGKIKPRRKISVPVY